MKDDFYLKLMQQIGCVCKVCLFSTVLLLPPSIVVGMPNTCFLSWQEAELLPWLLMCQILVLLTMPTHGAKHVIVLLHVLIRVRATEAHCHHGIEIGEICITFGYGNKCTVSEMTMNLSFNANFIIHYYYYYSLCLNVILIHCYFYDVTAIRVCTGLQVVT